MKITILTLINNYAFTPNYRIFTNPNGLGLIIYSVGQKISLQLLISYTVGLCVPKIWKLVGSTDSVITTTKGLLYGPLCTSCFLPIFGICLPKIMKTD